MSPHTTALFLACATALVAASTDARTGLIPNWLTLSSLGLALVWYVGLWQGQFTGLTLSGLAAGATGPLLLYVGSRGRAIGGGDVKLLAALGAWLGPDLILGATLAGLLSLLLFALFTRRSGHLRMGPGLCAGTLLACGLQWAEAWP